MTTHDLKVHPEPFAALRDGRKRFEVRWERERRYEVGDVLRLREWLPCTASCGEPCNTPGYTGAEVQRRVTYLIRGPAWENAVPEGVVVLGLSETP